MNISIGGNSISFDNVKNSVEKFFNKLIATVLHKDSDDAYTYDGGTRLITDFIFGEKIKLASDVLGVEISDNDFVLNSSSGSLTVSDARNKLIDFSDTYGNTGVYAYVAGDAGIIDGRAFVNFEIIFGADNQSNNLLAGYGGSNLWGGAGFSADILTGGQGIDNFIVGKNEGNDHIANAAQNDTVSLHDVNLSDIVATASEGNLIGLALNTGVVLTVESSDSLSPAFQLSDGTRYIFNVNTKSWQSA